MPLHKQTLHKILYNSFTEATHHFTEAGVLRCASEMRFINQAQVRQKILEYTPLGFSLFLLPASLPMLLNYFTEELKQHFSVAQHLLPSSFLQQKQLIAYTNGSIDFNELANVVKPGSFIALPTVSPMLGKRVSLKKLTKFKTQQNVRVLVDVSAAYPVFGVSALPFDVADVVWLQLPRANDFGYPAIVWVRNSLQNEPVFEQIHRLSEQFVATQSPFVFDMLSSAFLQIAAQYQMVNKRCEIFRKEIETAFEQSKLKAHVLPSNPSGSPSVMCMVLSGIACDRFLHARLEMAGLPDIVLALGVKPEITLAFDLLKIQSSELLHSKLQKFMSLFP